MMDARVFSFSHYRDFLKHRLQLSGTRGTQKKFAEAAGCKASYFSKVMGGTAELTLEQAAALADYWHLSSDETEFFLASVELARAGTVSLRAFFQKRLQSLKTKHSRLSARLELGSLPGTEEVLAFYYSGWYVSAIHILVSIRRYQTPESIAQRLHLSLSTVSQTLRRLEKFGLIAKTKEGRWGATPKQVHLDKESPYSWMHHLAWRQRALADVSNQASLHYTGIYSISRSDEAFLKERLVELISEITKRVTHSPEEELVSLTLDWFRI